MYRQRERPSWWVDFRRRVFGPTPEEMRPRLLRRDAINLRVFRDIPLPSWKIVFPDKLLQFRPLDGLRADLLTVAGAPSLTDKSSVLSPHFTFSPHARLMVNCQERTVERNRGAVLRLLYWKVKQCNFNDIAAKVEGRVVWAGIEARGEGGREKE